MLYIALKRVTIYTSCPELYDGHLTIVYESGTMTHEGDISLATANPSAAFNNAEMIIITMPAILMKKLAEIILANTNNDAIIGVVPGNGGSELAFRNYIDKGNQFFGNERVPAIARLVEKGKIVRSTGYREELHVAALPKSGGSRCADFSYRLNIIKQLATFAGVSTQNIDKVMLWYKEIAIEKNEFSFSDFGITCRKDLSDFYLQ